MQTRIVKLKDWKDGTQTPVLFIDANLPDQKKELEHLKHLAKAVQHIGGKSLGNKLAVINNGSLEIDISALLTTLAAVDHDIEKKKLARAWVTNWLKDSVKPEWLSAEKRELLNKDKLTCRCGSVFRKKKQLKKHQKRCNLLKQLKPLFVRCEKVLERLRYDEKERSSHKTKAGKTKGHRPKPPAKRVGKHGVRRTKKGRSKRDHRSASGKG